MPGQCLAGHCTHQARAWSIYGLSGHRSGIGRFIGDQFAGSRTGPGTRQAHYRCPSDRRTACKNWAATCHIPQGYCRDVGRHRTIACRIPTDKRAKNSTPVPGMSSDRPLAIPGSHHGSVRGTFNCDCDRPSFADLYTPADA